MDRRQCGVNNRKLDTLWAHIHTHTVLWVCVCVSWIACIRWCAPNCVHGCHYHSSMANICPLKHAFTFSKGKTRERERKKPSGCNVFVFIFIWNIKMWMKHSLKRRCGTEKKMNSKQLWRVRLFIIMVEMFLFFLFLCVDHFNFIVLGYA